MKFKQGMFLAVALVLCLCMVAPSSAWGASVNVATIDDNYGSSGTYSSAMGAYYPSDYPAQTFTSLDITGVSAATLAGQDTLIFWGYNPSLLNPAQKADVNAWIMAGGKLIIWDSEDAYYAGGFDYTWLPYPFTVAAPGAHGASGWPLWIIEENQLSTFAPGPYQINNVSLSLSTDAVGDAAIFTATNPQDWCVDMIAQNCLGIKGPVHVYSKPIGSGIVIYCGLDWDCQTIDLKNILRNELNADYLPCSTTWNGNIEVTKVSDKTSYAPDDTITFTITVKNPADNPNPVCNAVLTDTPPSEVTLIDPAVYSIGTIAPGETATITIRATADTTGLGLINNAAVIGENCLGLEVYSGNDYAIFDISDEPINTPEFPTIALPLAMIIGCVFVISTIRRKDE